MRLDPLRLGRGQLFPPDQLVRDLIEDSYDLVVSALPKRVREQLDWAPETNRA